VSSQGKTRCPKGSLRDPPPTRGGGPLPVTKLLDGNTTTKGSTSWKKEGPRSRISMEKGPVVTTTQYGTREQKSDMRLRLPKPKGRHKNGEWDHLGDQKEGGTDANGNKNQAARHSPKTLRRNQFWGVPWENVSNKREKKRGRSWKRKSTPATPKGNRGSAFGQREQTRKGQATWGRLKASEGRRTQNGRTNNRKPPLPGRTPVDYKKKMGPSSPTSTETSQKNSRGSEKKALGKKI